MLAASRLEERTQSSDTAGSGRARLASARLAATKRARLAATKRAQLAAARKESRTHHLNGVSMLEAARAQARQQKRVFGMARFGPSESLARRLAPSYTTAPFGDLTVTVLATRDLRHLAGSAAAAAAVETAWSERCVSVSFSHAILSPLKLHISLSSTHSPHTAPHHTTPHEISHTHTYQLHNQQRSHSRPVQYEYCRRTPLGSVRSRERRRRRSERCRRGSITRCSHLLFNGSESRSRAPREASRSCGGRRHRRYLLLST